MVSAIITFAAYRIASAIIWMINPEDIVRERDNGAHQGMAIASVLYMMFVLVQTAYAAKVFQGIKDFSLRLKVAYKPSKGPIFFCGISGHAKSLTGNGPCYDIAIHLHQCQEPKMDQPC